MSAFSRTVSVEMDWLDESSFEIRGSLSDNVHALTARLVVSHPDFTIREATAEITRMPYTGYCTGAVGALSGLVGHKLGRGFRRLAAQTIGGSESCNHLHTLIINMGASAFQMNYIAAKRDPRALAVMQQVADDQTRKRAMVLTWMPQLRNSCYIFSEERDSLFENAPQGKPVDNSQEVVEDGKIL